MGYLDESWESKTIRNTKGGNSLAVQWLGLCVFTAEVPGSIPGRGIKIPKAARQKKQNNNNKKSKKKGKEKKPTVGRALIASSPSKEVWSLLDAW